MCVNTTSCSLHFFWSPRCLLEFKNVVSFIYLLLVARAYYHTWNILDSPIKRSNMLPYQCGFVCTRKEECTEKRGADRCLTHIQIQVLNSSVNVSINDL